MSLARFKWLGALFLMLGCAPAPAGSAPETTVWMDAPAGDFTQSSPLGNGRLGALLFGGLDEERIVLNESSV